jgi:hypothetical protein
LTKRSGSNNGVRTLHPLPGPRKRANALEGDGGRARDPRPLPREQAAFLKAHDGAKATRFVPRRVHPWLGLPIPDTMPSAHGERGCQSDADRSEYRGTYHATTPPTVHGAAVDDRGGGRGHVNGRGNPPATRGSLQATGRPLRPTRYKPSVVRRLGLPGLLSPDRDRASDPDDSGDVAEVGRVLSRIARKVRASLSLSLAPRRARPTECPTPPSPCSSTSNDLVPGMNG